MPGEAFRLAPLGRHDVDVGVAGVVAAEGNPLAVGREVRVGGLALEAGQAARGAAGALDHPDVVRVGKGDAGRAHRGRPQQAGGLGIGGGRQPHGKRDQRGQGQHDEHRSKVTHRPLSFVVRCGIGVHARDAAILPQAGRLGPRSSRPSAPRRARRPGAASRPGRGARPGAGLQPCVSWPPHTAKAACHDSRNSRVPRQAARDDVHAQGQARCLPLRTFRRV